MSGDDDNLFFPVRVRVSSNTLETFGISRSEVVTVNTNRKEDGCGRKSGAEMRGDTSDHERLDIHHSMSREREDYNQHLPCLRWFHYISTDLDDAATEEDVEKRVRQSPDRLLRQVISTWYRFILV